jgi:hypothetical protein
MKLKLKTEDLVQHWVHSHEEDTAGETVFRPADYKFPRSRGRRSFELKADGRLIEWEMSPTDTRRSAPGMWKIDEKGRLVLEKGPLGTAVRSMVIASVESDRLVLKKG